MHIKSHKKSGHSPLSYLHHHYAAFLRSSSIHTAAVNNTSVDEFNAVSVESCKIPIMKPTPIICAATSSEIPSRLDANGINNSEPPATPAAPQAQSAATMLNQSSLTKETSKPSV